MSNLPWLTIGGFNEITSASEKEGGNDRPRQQKKNFINTINYCGLRDLGFFGPKFTWLYQRGDGLQTRERLDRAMATLEWLNIFPEAKVFHLTFSVLDHLPLALRMVPNHRRKKARKTSRFEAMWLRDQSCEEVVQKAWEEGKLVSSGSMWVSCIERCRSNLEAWNKTEFGHVRRRVAELQKRLEWLELQPPSPEINSDLRRTRIDLNSWLDKKNNMWHQRSRLNWLQSGDRNIGFFHAKAFARQ